VDLDPSLEKKCFLALGMVSACVSTPQEDAGDARTNTTTGAKWGVGDEPIVKVN